MEVTPDVESHMLHKWHTRHSDHMCPHQVTTSPTLQTFRARGSASRVQHSSRSADQRLLAYLPTYLITYVRTYLVSATRSAADQWQVGPNAQKPNAVRANCHDARWHITPKGISKWWEGPPHRTTATPYRATLHDTAQSHTKQRDSTHNHNHNHAPRGEGSRSFVSM